MPTTRNTEDATRADYVRPEVVAITPDLDLIHDLLGGTRRMHAVAPQRDYLRKWKDEAAATYAIRVTMEQVYEGLGRTLSAATGMLFATPPQLTYRAQESLLAPQLANLDGTGTAFPVLAKRLAEWAIRDGYAVILVDHPSPPEGAVVTAATERALNLRPVWAVYERAAVINWRTTLVANEEVLSLVVLRETADVSVGPFGVEHRVRYRVLQLVDGAATWALYEEPPVSRAGGDLVLIGAGIFTDRAGVALPVLPVAVAYAGRTDAPMTAIPPLLGVAWANLGHWQQATNLRFYRELAAFPQPTVIGRLASDGDKASTLKIGPAVAVTLTEGSDFRFTELQGSALDQVEAGVRAKEEQMAALGMSFLSRDKRASETAEAKRLDATAENSTLATAAQGIEDALNLALEHHARYLGLDIADAPTCAINRDYDGTTLSPAEVQAVATLVKEGMPVRVALRILATGGIVQVQDDAELDGIAMDWEAGRMSAEAFGPSVGADG